MAIYGISLAGDNSHPALIYVANVTGFPAEGKLRSGDRILQINGHDTCRILQGLHLCSFFFFFNLFFGLP